MNSYNLPKKTYDLAYDIYEEALKKRLHDPKNSHLTSRAILLDLLIEHEAWSAKREVALKEELEKAHSVRRMLGL